MKLIDLDACATLSEGYSGAKYSSAYLPPEMIYVTYVTNDITAPVKKMKIKNFKVDENSGMPILDGLEFELVRATVAHDVWSLGVTLFQVCSMNDISIIVSYL